MNDANRAAALAESIEALRQAADLLVCMVDQCERSGVLPPAASKPLRKLRDVLVVRLVATEQLQEELAAADIEARREMDLDDLVDSKLDARLDEERFS
jgi:hypothetical protein